MTKIVEVVNAEIAEISSVERGISALTERYGNAVYDVATTAGMDDAKKARAEIREHRYAVERRRKAVKAELAKMGKDVEKLAISIYERLMKIEAPIDAQIKAEEARKERERMAKIMAEQQRQTAIQAQLTAISVIPASTPRTVSALREAIASLEAMEPTEAIFMEFLPNAVSLRSTALETMKTALAAEEAREAEAERLKALEEALKAERAKIEEERAVAAAEREKAEAAERARAAAMSTIRSIRALGRGAGKSMKELHVALKSLSLIRDEISQQTFGDLTQEAIDAAEDSAAAVKSFLEAMLLKEQDSMRQAREEFLKEPPPKASEAPPLETETAIHAELPSNDELRRRMFEEAVSLRRPYSPQQAGQFLEEIEQACFEILSHIPQPHCDRIALILVRLGHDIDWESL